MDLSQIPDGQETAVLPSSLSLAVGQELLHIDIGRTINESEDLLMTPTGDFPTLNYKLLERLSASCLNNLLAQAVPESMTLS